MFQKIILWISVVTSIAGNILVIIEKISKGSTILFHYWTLYTMIFLCTGVAIILTLTEKVLNPDLQQDHNKKNDCFSYIKLLSLLNKTLVIRSIQSICFCTCRSEQIILKSNKENETQRFCRVVGCSYLIIWFMSVPQFHIIF